MKIWATLLMAGTTLIPVYLPLSLQEPDVKILKFSWTKERLPGWENNPFGPTFETFDAMRSRVASERRLRQARNAGNKSEENRIERDLKAREEANKPKKNAEKAELPRDGYRYRLRLRNTSDKTIQSIDWDYIFIDRDSKQEIACHQFTSDGKIQPGKDKDVSVLILSPPVRVTDAHELDKKQLSYTETVKIVRIEYSDGSVWAHP